MTTAWISWPRLVLLCLFYAIWCVYADKQKPGPGLDPDTVCAGMRVADAKYNQMLMDDDERTNVFLPIYTSHPLNIPTDDITSAVIFIHGGLSDADTYFCHGMNAAYADNSWDDDNEVLVIAPLFGPNQILGNEWQLNATWADDYTYDDTNDDAEDDVSVYFKKECWNRGCDSDSDDTDFTSSFDALDQLIDAISNTSIFPYMERITLAGFSAGGQMLNRYAWASPVGAKTASDSQPNISFIIANAGYHLYLDTYRPAEHCRLEKDTGPGWDCNSYEIPTYPLLDNMSYTPEYPEDDKEETCDGSWSGYHYDISSLPVNSFGYFQKFAEQSSRTRTRNLRASTSRPRVLASGSDLNQQLMRECTASMRRKDVRYIFGSKDACKCNHWYENPAHCFSEGVQCAPSIYGSACCDTFPDAADNVMSVTCGAEMQGSNRLQRGILYAKYLNWFWRDYDYETVYEVIDNGHNASGCFESEVFQEWAFLDRR